MKEATFTPVLKKKNKNDNVYYLKIRIIINRKVSEVSLGFRIVANTEEELNKKWNAKTGRVRETKNNLINFIEPQEVNEIIANKLLELKNQFKNQSETKKVEPSKEYSFFDYLDKEIKRLIATKHIGTSKKRRTIYLQLKEFLSTKGKEELSMTEIDKNFVRDLEDYFISKELSKNTYKTYIRTFRTIYNDIMKNDEFEDIIVKDPFRSFRYELEQTDKPFLTIEEVDKIDKSIIDKRNSLYNVRNYFMFCLYGQGMRVSDLKAFRWGLITEDDGNLIFDFNQVKTLGKHFVFINESLINILFDFMVGYEKRIEDFNLLYYRVYEEPQIVDYTKEGNPIKNRVKAYNCLETYIYDTFGTGILMGLGENDGVEFEDKYIYEELNKIDESEAYKLETYFNYTTDDLKLINEEIRKRKIELIKEYAINHKEKFIFSLLNEKDFKGIEFGKDLLSSKLYNKSETATTIYNKQLKRLQKKVFGDDFRLKITSHLARHTYTNIQIDKNIDLFDLSVSLGHKSLITTQMYINKKLHKGRVVKANIANGKKDNELQSLNSDFKEMLIKRGQGKLKNFDDDLDF